MELFPNATPLVADRSDWINIAQKRKHDSSTYLNEVFYKAAKDAKTQGDIPLTEIYELLSQVFSMYFKHGNANEPFGALSQMGAKRTAIVTDFSEKNLDLFEHLLGKSGDCVVDARLADVLWQRRRHDKFANQAIDAYLTHATDKLQLANEDWLRGIESLRRAAQICKQLKQTSQYRTRLISIAETAVQAVTVEPKNYYRIIILEIMAEFGLCNDPALWADTCDTFAQAVIAKEHHYKKARSYWECAIRFATFAKNEEKQRQFNERRTDAYIQEARWLRTSGASAMIVAERYSKAIEACRRLGGKQDITDILHQEMNEVQTNALRDMKRFETKLDLTELIESGRKAIESTSLDQVLSQIAAMATPIEKSKLRHNVEQAAEKFPFMHLISGVSLNEKGRVIARTSPVIASDKDTQEAGILEKMIIDCAQRQQLLAISQIETARETLAHKLPIDSIIFEDLVAMNPIVPQGREKIFVLGLKAGLHSDYIQCAHLLIPQIEHSVRTVMESSGRLVTRLTDDLTQKEHDLNNLLFDKSTEDVFGEDLVFSMRVLLVEELGGNFRNLLAHGLLSTEQFYAGWVNYLWALTIRLCWLGQMLKKQHAVDSSQKEHTKRSNKRAKKAKATK